MRVLVVGGGGREHAIAWKLARSKQVGKIYCAPGNGGMSQIAECIPIKAADIDGMVRFSVENRIDMVVVAPDDPLAAGMVNELESAGIRAFGPNREAAVIEASKSFSKDFMKKYRIPTARCGIFKDSRLAVDYLRHHEYPAVIKADGLALGKGVTIADSFEQACDAVKSIMDDRIFGHAGDSAVIEEFLTGTEVTVLAFTDGRTVVPMVSSQDHKRVFDGDLGPNTGGMGAFSPSRIYTPEAADFCMKRIFKPTVEAMNSENRKFKGVLYFGLIVTKDGPKVLEYNARFGDPEAQVVLVRLKNDIVDVFNAIMDEKLDKIDIEWEDNAAACIVAASEGYPGKVRTGFEITGISEAERDAGVMVFHAGTKYENGKYYSSGGRVLGVTAVGKTLDEAVEKAYEAVGRIRFDGMHYRKDIGRK